MPSRRAIDDFCDRFTIRSSRGAIKPSDQTRRASPTCPFTVQNESKSLSSAATCGNASCEATADVPASEPLAGYIKEFDGLRGLAILAVLIHHFWPRGGSLAAWSTLPHLGWVGVDLFFVLSGCLITNILLTSRGQPHFFRNFYARRALRIFPLYYLVVIGSFLVIPRLQGTSEFVDQSGSPWWYLFYLGNLRESITGQEPGYVLAVTWSLCIEEQFYLLFPLFVAWLPPERLRVLLWSLVAFAPVFRLTTTFVWPDNERIQYLATISRCDVLALGCLIALGMRGYGWLPSRATVTRAAIVALLVCTLAFLAGGLDRTTFFGRTIGYSLVAITAAFIVLWVVQHRGSATVAWLRWAPLCGLGVLCYGIYLLQRPAQVLTGKVLAMFIPGVDFTASGLGLLLFSASAVIAAFLSWHLFEKPFLRWKSIFPAPSGTPARDADSDSTSLPRPQVEVFASDYHKPPSRKRSAFAVRSLASSAARMAFMSGSDDSSSGGSTTKK